MLRSYISKYLFQENLDLLPDGKIAEFKDDVARDISQHPKKSHPVSWHSANATSWGWLAYEHLVAFRAHVDAYQKGRREWIRYAGERLI